MTTQNELSNSAINNAAPSKPKKLKKVLLIILGVFIVLAATGYVFYDTISLEYYNMKTNHAKTGDKLYPANWMVNSGPKFSLPLYRLTEAVDTPGKMKVINGGWEINSDSLAKHHSNFIGIYQGYRILTNEFGAKMLYYVISSNQAGLSRNYYENEIQLPKGYKFMPDKPFYVISFNVSSDGPPKGMAK